MNIISFFDPFRKGLCGCKSKYTLNPYTGCAHKCAYCYITSYIKNAFNLRIKENILNKVERDIQKLDNNIPLNIASSSDPYPPVEEKLEITRNILKMLSKRNIKVSIITKSPLVLRDMDILSNMDAVVSFTITHFNDNISKLYEPFAPPCSLRIKIARVLVDREIPVCIRIDPLIPGVNTSEKVIYNILRGVKKPFMVVFSTYKRKTDNFKRMGNIFPHLRKLKWEERRIRGYRYLVREIREEVLERAIEVAREFTDKIAVCREDIKKEKVLTSCDPIFELIKNKNLKLEGKNEKFIEIF